VHVLLDGSGAGRAAVRLAGRIALHLDAPISVGGTGDPDRRSARRAAAAVEALRRLGLDAAELSERPDAGAPAVLVVPEQGGAQPTAQPIAPPIAPSTTVIRVRPAASDEDEDLQEALARIPAMR
jgi:hypothetical protein